MIFRKIAKKILTKSPKAYTAAHTLKFENTHRQNFSKLNDQEKNILVEIKNKGYVVIPDFFDKNQCKSCVNDMDLMFKNNKELIHQTDYFDSRIFGAEYLSENINSFSTNVLLNNLANAYNAVPTDCGFTLAGKISSSGHEYGSGGPWHRDSYFRQFKSLLYLTDVDENHGPFQIISESHDKEHISNDTKTANLESMQCQFDQNTVKQILEKEPERLHSLTAKAGTVVLVDTSCIHRGVPLKKEQDMHLQIIFLKKNKSIIT